MVAVQRCCGSEAASGHARWRARGQARAGKREAPQSPREGLHTCATPGTCDPRSALALHSPLPSQVPLPTAPPLKLHLALAPYG